MISAHPSGQIFADLVICPYRFMGKESILSLLTHLQPEMSMKNGQIPPDSLTHPS